MCMRMRVCVRVWQLNASTTWIQGMRAVTHSAPLVLLVCIECFHIASLFSFGTSVLVYVYTWMAHPHTHTSDYLTVCDPPPPPPHLHQALITPHPNPKNECHPWVPLGCLHGRSSLPLCINERSAWPMTSDNVLSPAMLLANTYGSWHMLWVAVTAMCYAHVPAAVHRKSWRTDMHTYPSLHSNC